MTTMSPGRRTGHRTSRRYAGEGVAVDSTLQGHAPPHTIHADGPDQLILLA